MISILKIADLKITQDFQAREKINQRAVSDYEYNLQNAIKMPPISVVRSGEELIVVDGFHRLHAHQNLGRDRIEALITEGDPETALKLAIGANQTHGLRRSDEDKARAVVLALKNPDLGKGSDREIGKLCGVSHSFVGKMRASLGKEKSCSKFSRKQVFPTKPEVDSNPPPIDEAAIQLEELAEITKQLEEENTALRDRLAAELMGGTPQERAAAQQTIDDLRKELKQITIELKAVTASRDSYMQELAEERQYCLRLKAKNQKLNTQIEKLRQVDDEQIPF
jgi:hypothetical protein